MKQKIVSVAKYLSPTRSHVSQHVKPLFANRDRNSMMNQVCGSNVLPTGKAYPKTTYHPNNQHKASKTHLRRPGVHTSDLLSSTEDDDTDSYDIAISADANMEAETPKIRAQNSIRPYKPAVTGKVEETWKDRAVEDI